MMESLNLKFLRARWDELAGFGALAERHAHGDPSTETVKPRTFAEQVVLLI